MKATLSEDLKSVLQDDSIRNQWVETTKNMIRNRREQNRVLSWIQGFRDELLELIDLVNDQQELQSALKDHYVNMYSRWKILNRKMNYQAVQTGTPDDRIMVKGSLLSSLLGEIEELIDDSNVEKIDEFLNK